MRWESRTREGHLLYLLSAEGHLLYLLSAEGHLLHYLHTRRWRCARGRRGSASEGHLLHYLHARRRRLRSLGGSASCKTEREREMTVYRIRQCGGVTYFIASGTG